MRIFFANSRAHAHECVESESAYFDRRKITLG